MLNFRRRRFARYVAVKQHHLVQWLF